jgi:hypothetical protein
MKKVSILLLLTVVLASFTFAIEGVGDFTASLEITVPNVGSGDGGDPKVSFEPAINFSRDFGAVNLSATLGDYLIIDTNSDNDDPIGDGLYVNVTPTFTIPAGPGELGIALSLQANFALTDEEASVLGDHSESYFSLDGVKVVTAPFFRADPSISYGLDAGFGALAFELGTDHLEIAKNHGDKRDAYALNELPLYFQAGVDLSFGLGLWLKPVLSLKINDNDKFIFKPDVDKDTELSEFVFDIHYAINEQITAGVETSIPTGAEEQHGGITENGVTITPYGEFAFGALGAYVKVELSQVGIEGKTDSGDDKGIIVTPIIGVSYSF